MSNVKTGTLTGAADTEELDWPGGPGSIEIGNGGTSNWGGGTVAVQFLAYDGKIKSTTWKDLDALGGLTFTAGGENNFDFQSCRMRLSLTGGTASVIPFRIGRSYW